MRTFRHLSRAKITEIVVSFNEGVPREELAKLYEVDPSTISYHVRRFQHAYDEDGSEYARIKASIKKVCLHPSTKCTLCGIMHDTLRRTEWRAIEELTAELAAANGKLRKAGLLED